MKTNSLKNYAACLLAGAFISGNVFAATSGTTTTSKKTSTPAKTTTKKSSIFDDDKKDAKKDKTVMIPPSGWNGAINVTADASGNPTAASFTNAHDSKQYSIQIDDSSKKFLAGIKSGSKVQIKGSVVTKADGKISVKLTDCAALPENPPQPGS